MENIELAKAERDNAGRFFWLQITNVNIILPIAFYFLCSVGFGLTSALYTGDNTVVRILFMLLSGIAVRMFTDHWNKIQEKTKFRHKATSAVRNLDSIYLSLKKIEKNESNNPNLVERIQSIQWNILMAIDEWSDILPDIKVRDQSKLKLAIEALEKQIETLPADKAEDKEVLETKLNELTKEYVKNDIPLRYPKKKFVFSEEIAKEMAILDKLNADIKSSKMMDKAIKDLVDGRITTETFKKLNSDKIRFDSLEDYDKYLNKDM